MMIKIRKRYILIISQRLVNILGFLSGVGTKAKGAAFFPFIFVRSDEYIQPWLITHERIHFRQQLETLFIGSIVLTFFERLYAQIFLKKSRFESYIWASSEQEAYLNQHDLNYLNNRKIWNRFKYLKNKKKITLLKAGEIVVE